MCPLDENGQTTCPDLNSPDIPWYFNGNYIVILIVCVVVVPLASLKSIEFLGYTSGNQFKTELSNEIHNLLLYKVLVI